MNRSARGARSAWLPLALAASLAVSASAQAASLVQVTGFGTNPTNLTMHLYVPDTLQARPPLLLALHYCTGTGQAFFSGTEWRSAADRYGFIVIYPSATRSGQCWDVSSAAALRRDGGSDPVGLRSMISYVQGRYPIDTSRIFVTGASSGAMMTNVMLGDYPDVFAAGAAFMGVPFGCFATSDGSGWNSQCANGQISRTAQQWGDAVRNAYPGYTGARPRMQLWHGTTDATLNYNNFGEEIKQWTNVLGLSQTPSFTDTPQSGWTRTRYGGTGAQAPVEAYSLAGTGHSMMLNGQVAYAVTYFGLDQPSNGTTYALTVTKAGTGSGTVISSTGGINCGSTCSTNIASGTTVTLTATAAAGSSFASWGGACTGSGTCTVSMTAARAVTATFNGTNPGGPISINAGGAATGSFVADVNYSGGSTYSTTSAIDTSLVPSPVPPQAVFQSERYGEFSYTIPGLTAGNGYAVTLYFSESYWTAAGQRTFNVSINGSAVLTAFDIFATAGGANRAVARTFQTTANASGQVVIQFARGGGPDNPKVCGIAVAAGTGTSYTLSVTRSGNGTVTSSTGGIDCGAACSASFTSGTAVTLTATPASGSTFGGWGGACTGSGACVVTMTAAQAVTATFTGTGTGGVFLNAGGAATGSWAADAYFSGGTTYTNSNTVDVSGLGANAPPAAVFQSERYGAFTYTIPNLTAGAAYTVTLYFAETYHTAAGRRVFGVNVNGATALSGFDIYAAAGGQNRAISRSFSATANASGQIVIQFVSATENPKVNALAVVAGDTPPPPPPPAGGASLNAGGAATGTFSADAYFSGGTTYTNSNTVDVSALGANAPPAAVFQSERYGAFTYTIPSLTAGAAYTVRLYFAETYHTAAGRRVFSVAINGATALSSFDIYASAGGQNRAISRTFNATASSSGQIVIQFVSGTENPKVNALSVTPGASDDTDPPPPPPPSFDPCPASGDCKVLPLGDSITDGFNVAGGYRIELFRRARGAGKRMTFVGSLVNGPTTVDGVTFPRNHEGHSGSTIDQIAGLVPSPATSSSPNVVLLMAGTNDMYGTGSGASQRLDALLGKLVSAAPNALIVVAQLTPLGDSSRESLVRTFNAALPAIVNARRAQGQHVVLVDMHTGFPTSELADGTHPNSAGYARMAGVWYAAISSYLH